MNLRCFECDLILKDILHISWQRFIMACIQHVCILYVKYYRNYSLLDAYLRWSHGKCHSANVVSKIHGMYIPCDMHTVLFCFVLFWCGHVSLYSLSGKTSCRQISWCLKAARLDVMMIVSLWNLTGISVALLPRCLSNFGAIVKV